MTNVTECLGCGAKNKHKRYRICDYDEQPIEAEVYATRYNRHFHSDAEADAWATNNPEKLPKKGRKTILGEQQLAWIKENAGKYPITEIAEKFNVSYGTIHYCLEKLGLKSGGIREKIPKETIAWLQENAQNYTRGELIKRFNLPAGTLGGTLTRMGIKPKKPSYTCQTCGKILKTANAQSVVIHNQSHK